MVRARVLVLRECIWNASTVSLVIPAFDDTGSLGSTPRRVLYPPGFMVLPWMTASRFLAGIREAELTPTTFSSPIISLFSFLSFSDPPIKYLCCLLGLLYIYIYIIVLTTDVSHIYIYI